ncbi:hypothetical protein B7P43_G10122 [Cryptotermes secundus]|uniref:Uncharacterized protein n=1 Tax=Cryptotermes secundus TaxID=105785 RepID=A0A2J7QXH9_9NEOP|nr:uncharacterized protein LOC111864704 [Cryptotermes secundus]PNF33291.1 hypothetical protein B7P43_G10122 [Cryptotermes secundus]
MRCLHMLVILNVVSIPISKCEEEVGSEYLRSVINKLQSERIQSSVLWNSINLAHTTDGTHHDIAGKIIGPTPLPTAGTELDQSPAEHIKQKLPLPQPLSKEELAALYQAAVNKGAFLDLASMTSGSVQGAQALENLFGGLNMNKVHAQDEQAYYYYFFPIKSFDTEPAKTNEVKQISTAAPSSKPASQAASLIPTAMMILDSSSNKSVEPLFMAIAGFVGMALMFAVSVLFLPKFGNLRSRGISALKHVPDELATLTKLVLDGIDGKDCTERIACEVGHAVRRMQLDKKPIRVLEILLPPSLSKQLQLIRKAAAKKEKCNFIPCKWKGTKAI